MSLAFVLPPLELAGVQNIFGRQAAPVTTVRGRRMDTYLCRPYPEWLRSSLVCKRNVIALVVCLLFRRRPSHVPRLVIAVIVDSVDGIFGTRARPYIVIERRKRIAPFWANLDSARSVESVIVVRWIVATSFNVMPNAKLRQEKKAHWFSLPLGFIVAIVAAATHRVAAAQVGAVRHDGVAAVAAAKPERLALLLDMFGHWGLFDDGQPAIPLAGFVLLRARKTRGMMTHAESSLQGSAMPWDVDASPGRFYSVLTSPLYHITEHPYTYVSAQEGRS